MKKNRNHNRNPASMHFEMMEPRLLLPADALMLAGLPGIDPSQQDAPWDLLPPDFDAFGRIVVDAAVTAIEPTMSPDSHPTPETGPVDDA